MPRVWARGGRYAAPVTAGPVTPPEVRAPRGTLAEALSGRDNALNFVRLVLAATVIVGHAFPLGFGPHPGWGGSPVGEWAVAGFFGVSGYLIASSRSRLSFGAYLWRRALRIFPAFWVVLLVVAFVFAPATAWWVGEGWSPGSAFRYVGVNAGLQINQWGIERTLESGPYPTAWNGSLWTLWYEFVAYLALGVLFFVRVMRRPVALGVLVVVVLGLQPLAHGPLDVGNSFYLNGLWLAGFFLSGAFLWSISQRLPVSGVLALLAVLAVVGVGLLEEFRTLGAVPFTYLCLFLGGRLPVRLGAVNDISYGVYIYAFPVQQVLGVTGVAASLGVALASVVALVLTVPLAWASWVLVERPALRLKGLVRARR